MAICIKNPTALPFRNAKVEFEKQYVMELLKLTKGNVAEAARIAGKNRKDFYKLMDRVKVKPERFRR